MSKGFIGYEDFIFWIAFVITLSVFMLLLFMIIKLI